MKTETGLILARVDKARLALIEARDAISAKRVADMAKAAEVFATKQRSEEAKGYAHEIYVEALRLEGDYLRSAPKNNGAKGIGKSAVPKENRTPTLEDQGISKKESVLAQAVSKAAEKAPEIYEQAKQGGRVSQIQRFIKKSERQDESDRLVKALEKEKPKMDDRYQLHVCKIEDAMGTVKAGSVDWIITDPPYPKEFLPVYGALSRFAGFALKPGGSLICMVGQSYLPEVMKELGCHLQYQWMLAYLTPGGQAVQVWNKKVNTFWKPLLWYSVGKPDSEWVGDVCRSAVNDNDKNHHHWGQSESGMADIMERLTKPGQVICDPFCGGGTTGVVAVGLNRLFIGLDCDRKAIAITQKRLCQK